MKRLIITAGIFAAGAFALAGCTSGGSEDYTGTTETHISEAQDKIKIVTTIFPAYDWVKNVTGDEAKNIDLTLLCDNGTDMHSYQPTAEDIMKISDCDVFIYVGGESDEWVEDALKNAKNEGMARINLLEVLGDSAKKEETKEGMQETGDKDEDGYDEHVWLSLKNAEIFTDKIAETLEVIDTDNSDTYESNLQSYKTVLNELDEKYTQTVNSSAVKTLLFADRFPFRYMTDDYGIEYYAAFDGCSAETEASFETIAFLSKKIDELSLKNIMIIEGGDGRIAETVKANTASKDQNILKLDSMQSVTKADIDSGKNYISVTENNLEVLKQALQ